MQKVYEMQQPIFDKESRKAFDKIFSIFNPEKETIYSVVDLHGLLVPEAEEKVKETLDTVKKLLDSKKISHNYGRENHILKVIAGAGKHS